MSSRGRGRPAKQDASVVTDDDLLAAALEAFADRGYDGMSVRRLARDLGVSHNLIPQRFGSKERLWYAAVDHGFGALLADLLEVAQDPPADDVVALRTMIVRFVEANAARPALLRIINQEAAAPGERFDHLFDRFIEPVRRYGTEVLDQLHAAGRIRTGSVALVYFFMTHGAGGPFAMPLLAERLGESIDRDDPDALHRAAVHAVDVLFDGLLATSPET